MYTARGLTTLKLDDATYHQIDSDDVPPGYSSVPVRVDDNGVEFDATMIAGSVGMKYSSSSGTNSSLDTLQPESGWFMFEKRSEGEEAEGRAT